MSKNLCNSSTHWLIKLTLCIIINVLTFLFEIIWLATTVFPKAVVAFKIPLSYFKSMYSLSNEDIMKHIAQEIEVIADRNFIVYKPEFLNKIKKQGLDNMMYIADRKELNELLYEYEDIDYIKVNNNKYIVIY